MTSPPLCTVCGTHHHLWQAHVFRTITTQSHQPPVVTKDVSRSCVECEIKQREIDRLRSENNDLQERLTKFNEDVKPVKDVKPGSKEYFRDRMRAHRQAVKDRKARESQE